MSSSFGRLFATAIFGVVKFVASIMCALFLVDMIGCKRSLSIEIALQAVSMCYIAAFLTAVPNIDENTEFTPSQKAASTGGIVMIYISGAVWAAGWNSIQYLLNAEIYPLRIRAVSSSQVMCFHFGEFLVFLVVYPSMLTSGFQSINMATPVLCQACYSQLRRGACHPKERSGSSQSSS